MGALTVAFVKHLLRSWEESWWKTIEFRSSHNNVPRIRLILQWKIGQKLQFSSQIWHWRRRWVSEIRGLYRSQFFWGMKMTRFSKSAIYFSKWCDFLENWNALEFGNDDTFSMFGGIMQENYHFGEIIEISDLKEEGSLTSISKDMTLVWKVLEIGGNSSVILDSQTRDRFFLHDIWR